MRIYDDPRYYEIAFSFRNIPAEVDCLEQLIAKYSGIKVTTFFELASGNSPHIKELCRRGYRYIGLELSKKMVAYAQGKIKKGNLAGEIILGDMIQFSLPVRVDCALVFLGSLYVTSDIELRKHLDSVASVLQSGGLYVLESVVSFYPEDVHKQSWEMNDGSTRIITTYDPTWTDPEEKLMGGKITLSIDENNTKKQLEHSEVRKIYTATDFIAQAERSNQWKHVVSFSDFDIQKTPQEGARNILVLQRK